MSVLLSRLRKYLDHFPIAMTQQETVRPAFADREEPKLSYGIPFPAAAARHIGETFHASRAYVICSGSLSRNTDALNQLKEALGEKVVGVRIGMKSHTLWSEIIEIVNDARRVNADLLLTLGAGSLTDGAKIVSFVGSS
jgi:alcohol dehydrogenase class IV